jgi:hypothetical protein
MSLPTHRRFDREILDKACREIPSLSYFFLSTLDLKKQYCNWVKQEVRRRNMAPLHHRQLSSVWRGGMEDVSVLWHNADICVQEIWKYAVNSNYYNVHTLVPTYYSTHTRIQFAGTSIHIFKLLATQNDCEGRDGSHAFRGLRVVQHCLNCCSEKKRKKVNVCCLFGSL